VNRRAFLAGLTALTTSRLWTADYPPVLPGRMLVFPRDHGAHPDFRTEWWYVTGWVKDAKGNDFGVQVTFFRTRPRVQEDNSSAFAPKQILFAHGALADPRLGTLLHDQRAAREGFGLAAAKDENTDVRIDDWSLRLVGDAYTARIVSRGFAMALQFKSTGPILLEGDRGFSRKGPQAAQASYYYSRPQLAVSGEITVGDARTPVTGVAWLDHEWSSEYLAHAATGWDWAGVNLDDGGALMAFRMRGKDGGTYWTGGTLRDGRGRTRALRPEEIAFVPIRQWRSARTGVDYPVAVRVRAGELEIELTPLMDDQELDTRVTTGTIYWEGAVRATRGGVAIGRGYLELTGYWQPLRL
jgi:predicted secreted hydrolase